MRTSHAIFKNTLHQCKAQEICHTVDSLAKKLLMKDSKSFWKEINSINGANSTLIASTINSLSGHENIAYMWQDYLLKGFFTCKPDRQYFDNRFI